MFIDKARIFVTAGRGGAGCISFRREKYVPFGGPDGGNGGRGGDVYLLADPHLNTLLDLSYRPHYQAEDGGAGSSAKKYGRGADDVIIKVPVGTVVRRDDSIIADLTQPGQKILVARGGRGGRGNASFKTGRHTAPRVMERGEPGETATIDLELMLIADVGLVGFPNAGKSTFLSRISAARPKIADYPFTTLTPNLGVVSIHGKSIVVADIPGLIEGAHEGKGIGDEFLRHIQRTKVLIHLVDVNGFDEKTALANYRIINGELKSYLKQLAAKPMLIAANKMDVTGADKKLAAFKRHMKGKKIFPISAVSGDGVKELLTAVLKAVTAAPAEESPVVQPVRNYIYEPEFTVSKEDDGCYKVGGTKIDKLVAMTEFREEEALRRFQNILRKMGVEKALIDLGIQVGDTVRIGDIELEYEK